MTKLFKRDTAKCLNVSRSTLYRWITEGRIPVAPDGRIDTSDLLSRGFVLHASDTSDMSHCVPLGHFGTPDSVGHADSPRGTLLSHPLSDSEPPWRRAGATTAEKMRLLASIEGHQQRVEMLFRCDSFLYREGKLSASGGWTPPLGHVCVHEEQRAKGVPQARQARLACAEGSRGLMDVPALAVELGQFCTKSRPECPTGEWISQFPYGSIPTRELLERLSISLPAERRCRNSCAQLCTRASKVTEGNLSEQDSP